MKPFDGSQRAYAQTVGTASTNNTHVDVRDPNPNDVNYSIGKFWQNTDAESLWYLNSFSSALGVLQADWINIESSIATISDTANTPVSASSGLDIPPNNIQLINIDGSMSILSDPPNHRIIFGLSGGSEAIDSIAVQTGTSPVVPDISGLVTFNGAVVAAGTNPVRSDGTGPNTYALEVQRSQAIASTNASNIGLAAFDSAAFDVDGNGFVQLNGGGVAITSVNVDANTPPGTDPVLPTAAGQITVTGGQVAAGTTTNVIRTDSLAANTYTIEVQRSQAVASSTVGDNGVSHFDSSRFTVNSDGFVSLNGSGVGLTITGQSGGALSPTLGNWNIFGASVAAGTSPLVTSGAGSTLTINAQRTQAIASTNSTNVGLAAFDSAAFDVDANGFVQLNGGGIAVTSFNVDANTPPGTDPVVPNASGQVTITGAQVAAGTIANVIRTDSLAANAFTIEIQRSQAVASTTLADNGVCHFNSAQFSVDANGFVSSLGPSVDLHTARYIVSAGGTSDGANYTTIATAYAAAVSAGAPQTVFIQPGTYTENITLTPGINLVAFQGDQTTPNVTIVGTLTLTTAGTVSVSDIRLQTNSAAVLAVTGSAASIVNLNNCYINVTNNTAISFTSSSSSAQVNLTNCQGNLTTTGIAYISSSSAGSIEITNATFRNTGSSVTASTISAGNLNIFRSIFTNPVTTSGTAGLNLIYSQIGQPNGVNVTNLTVGGSGANVVDNCDFQSGTSSAISISSTLTMTGGNSVFSTNTNAITGAGTLIYNPISFYGASHSNLVNVSVQTRQNVGPQILTAGITFDDTNVLANYAEGTFTPTMTGASTAGTTTYTTQVGLYTRIGRLVVCQVNLAWTTATGTGQAVIGGFPFTIKNTSNYTALNPCIWSAPLTAANTMLYIQGLINTTSAGLGQFNPTTGGLAALSVASNTSFFCTFSYFV